MLTTERLRLRDYRREDFARVHAYASIPGFSRYMEWGPNTEQDTRQFLERVADSAQHTPRFEFELAVILRDSGLLVGGASLRRDAPLSVVGNIGYSIHPEHQGQGIATEATTALFDFAFGTLGMAVIWASCDTRNAPSYAVMEKLGMRRVGTLHRYRNVGAGPGDSYRYEIVASDWRDDRS